MIITPYSALDTEAELAVTTASFPALKHFFQCDEAAGARSMTDIVGGVVVPTSALTKPDANSISANAGSVTVSDAALTSGSWVSPGTKKTILFAVGQFVIASKVWLGSGVGTPALGLSGQTTSCSASNGTTSITGTALTGGAVYGIGMLVDWAGNLTTFEAIGTGASAYSAKTPVAMTGLSSSGTIPSTVNFNGITSMYGFAVFEFDGALPTDVASAVTWMTNKWITGEKVIYPGWKGRA